MIWAKAVSFVNARVVTERGVADSVRFSSRILGIDDRPRRGDTVVDLEGSIVLPGLVNAHDHLELNHYGRLKRRERYRNASEWIADMRPCLASDPAIRDGRAHPLIERLFIGGLKETCSPASPRSRITTRFIASCGGRCRFRVVRRHGWAHSFLLETCSSRPARTANPAAMWLLAFARRRPTRRSWSISQKASMLTRCGELPRLESLGCLGANTVIVHGVAIDGNGWRRAARAGAGLVWCPRRTAFLDSGCTALVRELLDLDGVQDARLTVALGTDSRITGSRDLLDEMPRRELRLMPVTPAASSCTAW